MSETYVNEPKPAAEQERIDAGALAHAINCVVAQCHAASHAKGWHEEEDDVRAFAAFVPAYEARHGGYESVLLRKILDRLDAAVGGTPVMTKLGLITTEVAEAMEDYRNGVPLTELYWLDETGARRPMTPEDAQAGRKPLGFASEMADVLIRLADLCGSLAIDLGYAYKCKTLYNGTRKRRHGNKRA